MSKEPAERAETGHLCRTGDARRVEGIVVFIKKKNKPKTISSLNHVQV